MWGIICDPLSGLLPCLTGSSCPRPLHTQKSSSLALVADQALEP